MQYIDLPIDLNLVPAECIAKRAFSFYDRLIAYLLLPALGSFLLVLLAAVVVAQSPRSGWSLGALLSSSASWSLHIWMLLVVYPMISSATFRVFDCLPLRGVSYLRADSNLLCDDSPTRATWRWVGIASVIVYCLGMPLFLLYVVRLYTKRRGRRQYESATRYWRQRVSLLIASYRHDYWWFESFDLIRKLILASVVQVMWPNTKTQLWFGNAIAAGTLLVTVQLQPYQSLHCQRAQVLVQSQLLFTYMSAQVFFHEPMDERKAATFAAGDIFLMAGNCALFGFLLAIVWLGARTAFKSRQLRDRDGFEVHAPRLGGSLDFHLFLSQCATVRGFK